MFGEKAALLNISVESFLVKLGLYLHISRVFSQNGSSIDIIFTENIEY